MTNLVQIQENQVMTTWLKVVEVFEKSPGDVLRAIENLACSENFKERNFAFIPKIRELSSGESRL